MLAFCWKWNCSLVPFTLTQNRLSHRFDALYSQLFAPSHIVINEEKLLGLVHAGDCIIDSHVGCGSASHSLRIAIEGWSGEINGRLCRVEWIRITQKNRKTGKWMEALVDGNSLWEIFVHTHNMYITQHWLGLFVARFNSEKLVGMTNEAKLS